MSKKNIGDNHQEGLERIKARVPKKRKEERRGGEKKVQQTRAQPYRIKKKTTGGEKEWRQAICRVGYRNKGDLKCFPGVWDL